MRKKVGRPASRTQKARLLGKARMLFWKKGYHATSIRDIAAAFGCKQANIYNYFPNKETMLYTILHEEVELMLEKVIHLETEEMGDPVQELTFFIRTHAEMTLGHRRSSKLLFDSELDSLSAPRRRKIVAMRDRFDGILRGILMRGNATGQLVVKDEKLAAIAIVSIIARARLWFSPRGSISKEDFIRSVTEMVLNGLKPRA